jgi:inner membrane protein
MPSPVGHALGGAIIALALAPRLRSLEAGVSRETRQMLTWCAVAACLPDIDFAWGRHNMETHSVGFALIVGAGVYAWKRSTRLALACALAVCTHALFDWLGSDDVAPLGVMALWPFSREFYYSHAWLFGAISRHYWRDDFVTQNVLAVLREVVMLSPIVWLMWRARR